MYLIYHVTLQDHVIKRSCDFTKGSSSLHVTILPGLVFIDIVIVDICNFLRDFTGPRVQMIV